MSKIPKINVRRVVSSVILGNNYSCCRLCLKEIQKEYVSFCDMISIYDESYEMAELMQSLFGEKIEEIAGIESVCPTCVDKMVECQQFIQQCKKSTSILNTVFDNVSISLYALRDVEEENVYIDVDLEETKIIIGRGHKKKKMQMDKKNIFVELSELECAKCSIALKDFAELKAHNISYHATFTCDKCYETFPSNAEFDFHLSHKHRFQCSECPQHRASAELLKEHINKAHSCYVCKECGKSLKGLDKLNIHEQKHKNTLYVCIHCGKKYQTRDFFLKHTKLCSEGLIDPHPTRTALLRPYSCEKCGKRYSTPGGLRVHNRFVHGNAKPHVCKHCNKKFTAPSYLKLHMIKHTGEKNFECHICSSRFVTKEALLYHIRRHTGEKPYSCKICQEKFVNASARAEHIKFKHVGPTLECGVCSRRFVTSFFLRKHMSRHDDPSSKLYSGRSSIPPNVPGEMNMRCKTEVNY